MTDDDRRLVQLDATLSEAGIGTQYFERQGRKVLRVAKKHFERASRLAKTIGLTELLDATEFAVSPVLIPF